jgi:predicted ribosome quality control (RQC) complex YloA/Tae2 family protein
MHLHYFTLRQLAGHLEGTYRGQKLRACFSQQKNELMLAFDRGFLRVGCQTPFSYITPLDEFSKARRNVADLFPEVLGQELRGAEVLPWERLLMLNLEEGWQLALKMHGMSANVLLLQGGLVKQLFNQRLSADLDFVAQAGSHHPERLEPPKRQDEAAVLESLRRVSPVYDRLFARRALRLLEEGTDIARAFSQINEEAQSGRFYLLREAERMRLLALDPGPGEASICVEGVAPALRLFTRSLHQYDTYRRTYKACEAAVVKPYERLLRYAASQRESIRRIEEERNPRELGDLLMAHLHLLEVGQRSAEVEDFYLGGQITLKLDPQLSPQENAARYYEKHKERRQRQAYLESQLAETEEQIESSARHAEAFARLLPPERLSLGPQGLKNEELAALKAFARDSAGAQEGQPGSRPFRTFDKMGYEILAGKNAQNNDELTFRVAAKQDLWLHAKDVTGSHVVIRRKGGKDIPPEVLEYAARLAAYFSRRRGDTLTPVQYTLRKYVRKRKGDPPGMVVLDREEVMLVEPMREEDF